MIKCIIKVGDIIFPKDKLIQSGDFAIFRGYLVKHIEGEKLKTHPIFKTVSIKGNVPHIRKGDSFTMLLEEGETNQYGTTYIVSSVIKEIDKNDPKQVREYLAIMCGKKIANELMKIDNPYDLLEQKNDEELLKIKGIKESKLAQIYKNMDLYSDDSLAYVHLLPLGLTKTLIKNICLACGGATSAIDICKNNPYLLSEKVNGISFTKADEIALKCGHSITSKNRIKYAILHILKENGDCGRSYLTGPQLMTELNRVLSIQKFDISVAIEELVKEKKISISSEGSVALSYYLDLEYQLANEIKRIRDAKSNIVVPDNWRDVVKDIESEQGWNYTEEQLNGIEEVLNNNIIVISGKAGSGKSSVTNAMTKILKKYTIDMCCLSAKAAQRLTEVNNMEAKTIHRLLGLGLNTKDQEPKIYSEIVILDEASMVSGTLFLLLLKAIPSGSKVVILGDDGQLTAIGNCAVFSDLMKSGAVTHIELTEIHRQAKKSAIITKSIDIRNQKRIYESGFYGHKVLGELQDLELFVENNDENLLELVKNKFIQDLQETKNILEVQIISAMKTRGNLSIKNINEVIQNIYNPKTGLFVVGSNDLKIFEGDKVINLKNNYNTKNVKGKTVPIFNGNIGIVKEVEEKQLIVDFVGIGEIVIESKNFNNINLAYAISCHSSQGSQWLRTICAFDMSSYVLLNVELLYTALTRAEKHCSLIIEDKAMQHALRTVEQKSKQTLLPIFL